MKALILATLIVLVGCASAPTKYIKANIDIPPSIVEPCAMLDNKPITLIEDILNENINLYKQYAICARKQDDSIKVINHFKE